MYARGMNEQIQIASVQQETTAEMSAVAQIRKMAPNLVVASHEDYEFAGELLRKVQGEVKRLEDRRTQITRPINEGLRSINELFRPVRGAWEGIAETLKSKMTAYRAVIEEQQRAAMAAEAGGTAAAKDMVLAQPAATGVSTRRTLCWKITDEDAVGRHWCSPDPKKIQAALDAGQRVTGVEIWFEDRIIARAK